LIFDKTTQVRKPEQEKYAYDARVALWPSRDPIGEEGGVNLYGMMANNLIELLDYFGLSFCCGGRVYIPNIGLNYCGTATEDMIFNTLTEQCCSAQNKYYKVPKFTPSREPFNGALCCGPAGNAWKYLPVWRGIYSIQNECIANILGASWLPGGRADAASTGTTILSLATRRAAGLLGGLTRPNGNQVARQIANSYCRELTCQNPAGGL